jgi:phage virion morphogenesis protein
MAEGEFIGMDVLKRRLDELARDLHQVERPLKAIGTYMVGSVQKNFQAQGRPQKWTPLAPSTLRGRRKGKGSGGPSILTDTARLKNSIQSKIAISADPSVSIGSNVKYARRQQEGFPKGTGRGHAHTPARPFLVIQDEDVPAMGKIVVKVLEKS